MTDTNAIERKEAPMSLAALSDLMKRANSPVGFVISPEALEELKKAAHDASPSWFFGGIAVVADPAMQTTEVDVAFTDEAWRKRLAAIRR